MKKLYAALACLLPGMALAQPAGYYDSALGKTGEQLRVALYKIIRGHTQLSYTPDLWNAYYTTDVKPGNGKLYTIYSDKPGSTPPYEYTIGAQQCGSNSPSAEGSCYNREHTWPQSKFGSAYPMYTDLWIVYPTDYYVNSLRADYPYGQVANAARTFLNGSKLGPNTFPGAPASTAFEPIDSFKGDIARTYFYITTRYYGDSAAFKDWEMAARSTLKPWAIQMLLQWHHADPVSAKEKARNEAVAALQHNRNPFIDMPQLADCIWGGSCTGLGAAGAIALKNAIRVFPNPVATLLEVRWDNVAATDVLRMDIINMQGQLSYHLSDTHSGGASIDVAQWPRGMYFLQLRTTAGVATEKLIVQ